MAKAVFFDIDGTILARGVGIDHITERVKAAMRDLQKAGHKIFIATGRPASFLYGELLSFGFDGFVTSNGALVIIGGEVVFRSELDIDGVKSICGYAASENVEYMLESYPDVYCPRGFTACEDFFRKVGVDYSGFIRDFEIDGLSVSKIECVTARKDTDNLAEVYAKILSTPGFTGWSDPFHFRTMEIYSSEVSKASGIMHVLEHFGIDVADSYAFGDGHNDREMLQAVGMGFAMGTANAELQRLAKYTVPSVFDDGVAIGIEHYILGE